MKLGFVGLGKMGKNMVLNLLEKKHKVVAYNRTPKTTKEVAKKGAIPAYSLQEMVNKLPNQRVVWLMVPHQVVDSVLNNLTPLLKKGDIVVDGGNSFFKESMRRGKELKKKGIFFFDVGTSGGVYGARHGACMMIGGEKAVYKKLEKLFKDMNTKEGYFYCGPSGSGHFVKMVHNGVEYAIMEAYAEGFELLAKNMHFKMLDLEGVAHVWNHGSIVQSFLLEKMESALKKDPRLKKIVGEVADSGEGRWTVHTAIENAVDIPVIAQSLFARFRSRETNPFSDRMLAATRFEFGGHEVKKK